MFIFNKHSRLTAEKFASVENVGSDLENLIGLLQTAFTQYPEIDNVMGAPPVKGCHLYLPTER